MTIHAFIGEKASRTHENRMLQAFLEQLEGRWHASSDWIYVIANAMWQGAEVDLVCLLPNMVVVADFKHFSGRVCGAENGPWLADQVAVKGGAQQNPFVQLRNNRQSIIDWLKGKDALPGRNLRHVAACVIFSGPIEDRLDISQRSRSWFSVTDLDRAGQTLDQLASPQLALSQEDGARIVELLGVTRHRWHSSRPPIEDIGQAPLPPPSQPLTDHQQEAKATIARFLTSPTHRSLSIAGMTCSGKTRLMAEVLREIEHLGRKAVPLVPNARLAAIADAEHGIGCESIYQHLYMSSQEEESAENASGKKNAAIIPLRVCNDAENCVYLVDDAHLLGNSLFQTVDGKQYGSGHLLDDLFDFAALGKSARQIVFFGDPYQLQRAASQESALLGTFQAQREVPHACFTLEQMIDVSRGKARLHNARALVEAMRTEQFAQLQLEEDETFRVVDARTAAQEMEQHFKADPHSVWYLADTHAKVAGFVHWLRPRLFGRRTLAPIEAGEFIELQSAYRASNDPPGAVDAKPGYRYQVEACEPVLSVQQPLNGRPAPVSVRFIPLISATTHGVLSSNLHWVLVDYIVAEKPELAPDVAIAARVWLGSRHTNRHTAGGEEAPQTEKDTSTAGYPGTLARYGYATTVHHAQGMSQALCYLNADHAAGRHSDAYFRWLYTALTTAERTLAVFNYSPIHPLDGALWNARSAEQSNGIPVGAGWRFDPDQPIAESDQQRDVPAGLAESKNRSVSIAIWLQIARAVEACGWSIARVIGAPYRERYELSGEAGACRLDVAYDGKYTVKAIHLDDPAHWELQRDVATACLRANGYSPEAGGLMACLSRLVGRDGWQVVSAIETSWLLHVGLARGHDERIGMDVHFDKQGLATTLRPIRFSQAALLEEIRGLLQ